MYAWQLWQKGWTWVGAGYSFPQGEPGASALTGGSEVELGVGQKICWGSLEEQLEGEALFNLVASTLGLGAGEFVYKSLKSSLCFQQPFGSSGCKPHWFLMPLMGTCFPVFVLRSRVPNVGLYNSLGRTSKFVISPPTCHLRCWGYSA